MEKNLGIKSSTNDVSCEKAIAYLRVSTQEQKEKGNSLESQEQYIRNYANRNGYELIDIVAESKSASKVDFDDSEYENSLHTALNKRPVLQKLISTSDQSKFKHLIVSTRDRLARNLEVYVGIKLFLKKRGIKVHFANPSETMNIENKGLENFMELVFASIAELEANLISDRVRDGMAQKVRNGYWPGGKTPYGYEIKKVPTDRINGKQNKMLVPKIIDSIYIEQIFKLHNHFGYSYRKIAKIMNQQYNTCNWNKSKIERIITNKTYTGKISWGRRSRRNYDSNSKSITYSTEKACKEIILDEQWTQSENLRLKKHKIKDKKYYSTPFILRDKLVCGLCESFMEAKNYGNDRNGNPREGVYRCTCTKNQSYNDKMVFKKSLLENKFIEYFLSNLTPININILWYHYSMTKERILNENDNRLKEINLDLQSRKKQLERLDSLILSEENTIILKALKSQRPILENEISILETYRSELSSFTEDLFLSESELQQSLKKLFKEDFSSLTIERKRIIIDMLIDKIVVNKPKNNPKLTIYMTTNIDIL